MLNYQLYSSKISPILSYFCHRIMSAKPSSVNEEWLRHFQNITIRTRRALFRSQTLIFFSVRVIIVFPLMKITHFDYEIFWMKEKHDIFIALERNVGGVRRERQRRFIIRFKCLSCDEWVVDAHSKQHTAYAVSVGDRQVVEKLMIPSKENATIRLSSNSTPAHTPNVCEASDLVQTHSSAINNNAPRFIHSSCVRKRTCFDEFPDESFSCCIHETALRVHQNYSTQCGEKIEIHK